MFLLKLSVLLVAVLVCVAGDQSVKYVLEGMDVTLECRIPRPLTSGASLYWMGPVNGTMDNYAIGNSTFDKDYRVNLNHQQGRYDLTIKRATYNHNNGVFSCRVKEEGTGFGLHSMNVNLTVLIKPGSPRIQPLNPTATQGHPISLTCESKGGSPDPTITWYRKSTMERLQSVLKPGGGRDFPTTSVLKMEPRKEDDGEEFLCQVHNMALEEHEKMVSSVKLNVNYYPIVRITPSNPVRVIEGEDIILTCDVDAKPKVQNVRWMRGGAFIQTTHTLSIPSASLDDAGRYICQADNRLGRPGEAEVTVDVLYPPTVIVPPRREVNGGESVSVFCNVSANPTPDLIYWTRVGDDSFKQKGEYLMLNHVTSADHGDYMCHATTIFSPARGDKITLRGNATLGIRVNHAPGKSFITPAQPVAVEGKSSVLTCGANPPGYPVPQYRWWRGDDAVLKMGENFTIISATKEFEGTYFCQPYNSMGNGSIVMTKLRVFQPPRIYEGLKPTATHKREITDLKLSCRAQGKPKPIAKWYKDGEEIKESDGFYVIQVNFTELDINSGFQVLSTLLFRGPERIGQKGLRPEDRGTYDCAFENEAQQVKSSQLLRIQHPPAVAHKQSEAAYDVGDDAQLACRMRAFPTPSFSWVHNRVDLPTNQGGRYSVNDTDLGEDLYLSVLTIRSISIEDYGAYTCKATNDEGPSKTILNLQRKGSPKPSKNLFLTDVGYDFLEVSFDPGFDGGYPKDTNYSIQITANGQGGEPISSCSPGICLIEGLTQNTEYRVRIFSVNPQGNSPLSESIIARTSLNPEAIPPPNQVFVKTDSGVVLFTAPDSIKSSALALSARLEVHYDGNEEWNKVPSEVVMEEMTGTYELGPITHKTEIRVQLCAKNSIELCGPFTNAKHVSELPLQLVSSADFTNVVIVISVVVVLVLVLFMVIVICCCCRQQRNSKLKKKADMEVTDRGVITQQQAPPPPYYTVGVENKGMEGSIDQLNDHNKALIYGTQQYQNFPPQQGDQQPPTNGVNYMDNSYSNSNNGGSVNSQDSLWQVKGQHQDPNNQQQHAVDPRQQPGYNNQYNPVVHGGYGISGYDDYAHYPLPNPPPQQHQQPMQDDYHRGPYSHDPYAQHKPRGIDTVDDGYDVSGMPNPYMDPQMQNNPAGVHNPAGVQMNPENKPQISFDESLESGFSTPNSRNRRIIREIIV